MPRPTYRLAMETTRRRLASARLCLARSPALISFSISFRVSGSGAAPSASISSRAFLTSWPFTMVWARATSCSLVSRSTLPISLRYIRTGSSMPKESTRVLGSTISSSGISSISSMGGIASPLSSGR